jgi:lipid II:glycine glycyltransferase (peptidoglycan interpeptide bridge formation enzyme)
VYNGEVLGGNIFAEDQDHILGHTSASKIIDNDKQLNTLKGNATHLITWVAMKYAKEKGIKEFDMGGLFTNSLNSFKESFGGKRVTYYAYYKDYDTSYKLAANVGLLLYRLRNSRSSFKK